MNINFEKIHEDKRGAIFLITGLFPEEKEVTLFITKEGYARGGCIHKKNPEWCCVLDGEIEYYIERQPIRHLYKGDKCMIDIAQQHYFVSLHDSIVIEWGATPAEKKEKGEWRKYVEHRNKMVDVLNTLQVRWRGA